MASTTCGAVSALVETYGKEHIYGRELTFLNSSHYATGRKIVIVGCNNVGVYFGTTVEAFAREGKLTLDPKNHIREIGRYDPGPEWLIVRPSDIVEFERVPVKADEPKKSNRRILALLALMSSLQR